MNHPYLHQNNSHRYAPFSPPPPPRPPRPPRPPHSFHENPTFYGNHHHHHSYHALPPHQLPLPPIPPSQPQPQQQLPSYRPFPPQRPYDLRQFIYNPHPDDRMNHHPRSQPAAPSSSSHHQFHDLPDSSWPTHRVILNHRVSPVKREVRPDLWDYLTRVGTENRPHQHHHVDDLDHHRQFDGRTVSQDRTIDRFRQDLEGDFRFREELSNRGFGHNVREDYARDMIEENYNCHSDRSSRDVGLVMRVYESNSSHYDNSYGSASEEGVIRSNARDGSTDNPIWVDERDIRDSAIEMENAEIDDGEVARILSRKVGSHITPAERYNDKGSRESSHELGRTPWKQIQKKSAFLRIQMAKPNHRNREDNRLHYSGYFEDTKSSSFRGKGSMAEDKEREGSPMELDVSFKSNSLVAKAIVAPSSSNISGIPKLDISTHVSNKASGSNRDSKQAKGEDAASSIDTKINNSTRPSSGTGGLLGKTKVEEYPKDSDLDKDGTDADPSEPKVIKKKKVVKKVVKRVTKPPSRLLCLELTGKVEESLKEDSSGHGLLAECSVENIATPLQEKAPACISRVCAVDSLPYANEATLLPENGMEDGSPKETVLKNVGTEFKNSACTVSNNDGYCNKPHNETTITDITNVENVHKPFCQKGGTLLQNGTPMEFLDVSFSVGGRISSGLLGSKENSIHENFVNTSNLVSGMDTTVSLDYKLFNSQESNFFSETVIMDSACKQVSENHVDLSVESGIEEGSPQVISLQDCSVLNTASNSVETRTRIGFSHAKSCNNSRDAFTDSDSSLIDAKEVNHVLGSTTCGQAHCDAVTTSPKNGLAKGPPDAIMSIQGNDEDKPNICNKGEVLTYQVDLSGSVTNGMCLGSIDVDSFHPPDTTLNLCHKNFRPAEGTDIEKGRVHVSLQSRAGGVDALHCSSLMDGTSGNEVSICSLSNVGSSVTSLEREEGMKSQVTFEGSSSPTASLTNERVLVADFCKSIIELASNS
ncbi:uncharacterized protein LOC110809476, partial [Carica papaya]|uniref:uncharacterized protein LOC110809476 n=1 Tax=Carica papaya TaxID=3649 RepID=UPI000B8D11CE